MDHPNLTLTPNAVYLISRLLASSSDGQVRRNGYRLLRKARRVTHNWMREIVLKLQDAIDDDQTSELQRRACDIAVTCRATFDIEDGTHLDALLCSSADVAIAIECAIVIHDNTPPHLGHTFPDFQKLLHRDHRLSHFLEAPLIELIQDDECGLDTAIASVWSSYRPGDRGWQQLDGPNSRWLTSLTSPLPGQRAQHVHYNILTGKLLVDGKPLGRLPQEIVDHPTYSRIFGQVLMFSCFGVIEAYLGVSRKFWMSFLPTCLEWTTPPDLWSTVIRYIIFIRLPSVSLSPWRH
jgi:hypothetical protein